MTHDQKGTHGIVGSLTTPIAFIASVMGTAGTGLGACIRLSRKSYNFDIKPVREGYFFLNFFF